jgi:hypothetical protein
MALVLADRVQETGDATGIPGSGGFFSLSYGAVSGYQSFAVIGDTNTTYYAAVDTFGNWEVGIGTYSTTGPRLYRDTILDSNNSGVFVSTANIFCTYPAEKSVYRDAAGSVFVPGQLSISAGPLTSSTSGNLDIGDTLTFSDTGVVSNFVTTTNSYLQAALQNKSNGTSASAEWIVYNDSATASTNYAAFGINSSGYTGTGSINAANSGFFVTGSSDLVLGTISSNAIHLVVNSGATDAMTVSTSGYIGMGNASPLAQLSVVGTGYSPNIPLSDTGTISWNTALGQVATFTFVTSNRAMGTPTNLVDGAFYALAIIQNSGNNTITSWASVFKWPSGLAPVLSTAAGAKDYFVFRSDGTNMYLQGQSLGVA